MNLFSPTFSMAPKSPMHIFTPDNKMNSRRQGLPKSFITQRKSPELAQTNAAPIDQNPETVGIKSGLVRFEKQFLPSKPRAEVPSKHTVYIIPDFFNPCNPESTQFIKVNLAQAVGQFFPCPPPKVLNKQPKGSVLSYTRLVELYEPSEHYEFQSFQNMIEKFTEKLSASHWELEPATESNNLRKQKHKPRYHFRYVFSLSGDPIHSCRELSHGMKILVLSEYSRLTPLHGIYDLFNHSKLLSDRESMVKTMMSNRASLWHEQTKPEGSAPVKIATIEKKLRLTDLASEDINSRIQRVSEDHDISIQESLAVFLEKVEYERRITKQEKELKNNEHLIVETDQETEDNRKDERKVFSNSPVHMQKMLKTFEKSNTMRSYSQPRKIPSRFSPSPPPPPQPIPERKVTTSFAMNRTMPKIFTRSAGFQVQKMKDSALHMSIDFGGKSLALCKEKNPVIPTPSIRQAPLVQKNRDAIGWSCSLSKYKRVKMTKRDLKALTGVIQVSNPQNNTNSFKKFRHSRSQSSASPNPIFQLDDNLENRGLDFKDIREFQQKYSLARKEIYSIKSRFMSLNRMGGAFAEPPLLEDGITLGEFLHTSPLVKDLIPRVASRLIQALGIDPGNLGMKIEWKKYVELYCILTQESTSLEILSKFWIKMLGVIDLDTLIDLLEDLLKGKSEGAHAWIVHHFSGNFIKRLVIEKVVDLQKRTVSISKMEEKFLAGTVVAPMMLSKATGMHEFEDVFRELTMTLEQQKNFDRLMNPVITLSKRRTSQSFMPAPASSQARGELAESSV